MNGASLSQCSTSTPVVILKKGVSPSGDLIMTRVFCRESIWHLRLQWVYHI